MGSNKSTAKIEDIIVQSVIGYDINITKWIGDKAVKFSHTKRTMYIDTPFEFGNNYRVAIINPYKLYAGNKQLPYAVYEYNDGLYNLYFSEIGNLSIKI